MSEGTAHDPAAPFAAFKAKQRDVWAGFAANEGFTTGVAGELVAFARIRPGERVLDAGCGTGVVAVTAARGGASVRGLDLTPVLLARGRENAAIARVDVAFEEGDVEALPYADAAFDVVVSQFGHMFAPRPAVATRELLRVLRPGGRIAFATWPPEHVMGQLFALIARYAPPVTDGTPLPAPPPLWGDPNVVRERLGDAVAELTFGRSVMLVPVLSPQHYVSNMEASLGPLGEALAALDARDQAAAASFRAELVRLAEANVDGNVLRQHFLMSRALKRS